MQNYLILLLLYILLHTASFRLPFTDDARAILLQLFTTDPSHDFIAFKTTYDTSSTVYFQNSTKIQMA